MRANSLTGQLWAFLLFLMFRKVLKSRHISQLLRPLAALSSVCFQSGGIKLIHGQRILYVSKVSQWAHFLTSITVHVHAQHPAQLLRILWSCRTIKPSTDSFSVGYIDLHYICRGLHLEYRQWSGMDKAFNLERRRNIYCSSFGSLASTVHVFYRLDVGKADCQDLA